MHYPDDCGSDASSGGQLAVAVAEAGVVALASCTLSLHFHRGSYWDPSNRSSIGYSNNIGALSFAPVSFLSIFTRRLVTATVCCPVTLPGSDRTEFWISEPNKS